MRAHIWRSSLVWLAATAVATSVAWWALSAPVPTAPLDAVLTRGAALLLVGCAVWAWAVTSLVLGSRSLGLSRTPGVPAWARRAVLVACGLALAGAAPAMATNAVALSPPIHDTPHGLVGLQLPDRTTGPAHDPSAAPSAAWSADRAADRPVTVRPGDSLWRLAIDLLPPHASTTDVAAVTDQLYELNRSVIGHDPNLITPGQLLRTPSGLQQDR